MARNCSTRSARPTLWWRHSSRTVFSCCCITAAYARGTVFCVLVKIRNDYLWDFYKNSFEDHHCKFCQLERLSRAITGPAQSLFWSEPGSSYVWTPVASDSFYCQVPTLHGLLYHWLTTLWRIEHNLSCSLGSPKDLKERFSVSWIWRYLEGNGNPLQCSCLENPRDGGAWWAAVYGVTQSRTRLKWLSLA